MFATRYFSHLQIIKSLAFCEFVSINFEPCSYECSTLPLQESVVEIEYLEKHPTPRPDNCLLHDDWISSIAVFKKWYVNTETV